jgi:hypothetical protein
MKRFTLPAILFLLFSLTLQAQTPEQVIQRHLETYAPIVDLETMSDISYSGQLVVYHNVDRVARVMDEMAEKYGGRATNATYFDYLSVDTDLGYKAFYLVEKKPGNTYEIIQAFGYDGNDAWIYDNDSFRSMTPEEKKNNVEGPFFSLLLTGSYVKESLSVNIGYNGYIGLSFLDNQGVMHDYELKDYRLVSDTFIDSEGWTVTTYFKDYKKVEGQNLYLASEQELVRRAPAGKGNGVQKMVFKLKEVSVNDPENWGYLKRPVKQ